MKQIVQKPISYHFTGTVGATHAVDPSTGIIIKNDAAETISVVVGGVTFAVKQSETFDADFNLFASVSIDPTTSLGVKQVETATLAVGNVTTAGNMAVIVTAAGMVGTPKTILVPVSLTDITPTLVMTKVRAALAADSAVTAMYAVGGTGAVLTLTRNPRAVANDGTLNVDLGGVGTTAVGITQVAASANTTAGVAPTTIGYRLWVRG